MKLCAFDVSVVLLADGVLGYPNSGIQSVRQTTEMVTGARRRHSKTERVPLLYAASNDWRYECVSVQIRANHGVPRQ